MFLSKLNEVNKDLSESFDVMILSFIVLVLILGCIAFYCWREKKESGYIESMYLHAPAIVGLCIAVFIVCTFIASGKDALALNELIKNDQLEFHTVSGEVKETSNKNDSSVAVGETVINIPKDEKLIIGNQYEIKYYEFNGKKNSIKIKELK